MRAGDQGCSVSVSFRTNDGPSSSACPTSPSFSFSACVHGTTGVNTSSFFKKECGAEASESQELRWDKNTRTTRTNTAKVSAAYLQKRPSICSRGTSVRRDLWKMFLILRHASQLPHKFLLRVRLCSPTVTARSFSFPHTVCYVSPLITLRGVVSLLVQDLRRYAVFSFRLYFKDARKTNW